MTRYQEEYSQKKGMRRDTLFDIEPFYRYGDNLPGEMVNDLRLKRFLKRAVEKEFAPQSLIDSIKNGIRR